MCVFLCTCLLSSLFPLSIFLLCHFVYMYLYLPPVITIAHIYFLYLYHLQLHCNLTHTRAHAHANTLAKYIDICSHMHPKQPLHILAWQVVFCAPAKKNQCDKKNIDRYERMHKSIEMHTYRLAQRQGDRHGNNSTSDNSKLYAIFFAFFIINLLWDSFLCFFVLCCFFLLFNYFITGTVVLWFLRPTFVTICFSLFLSTIYLHTNAVFEMQKETRTTKENSNKNTQMNGVFFSRFIHLRVCVCVRKRTKSKRSHFKMKNTNNNARTQIWMCHRKIADIKNESDDMAGNFASFYLELPILKLSFSHSFNSSLLCFFLGLFFNRQRITFNAIEQYKLEVDFVVFQNEFCRSFSCFT